MPRTRLFALLIVLLWLLPAHAQEGAARAEILWDEWGVPHIYAEDFESLLYGFGWAQARNHGDLILRLYGEARGRAAEYWGEAFRASDVQMHTLDVPGQGERSYGLLTREYQRAADAFTQGINDYAAAHPEALDPAVLQVLPVTTPDVLAHGLRVLRYGFLSRRGWAAAQRWEASGVAWLEPAPEMGSNGWAIAPSRSASGHALLMANPHQPWEGFGLWIEAHLNAPGVHAYGAALVGQPVLGIAFNENLGWTHTVNTVDGWDLYELTLREEGGAYILDGVERPFRLREQTLKIRQEDGTLREETLLLRESIFGPVVALRDGRALALRVIGADTTRGTMQWWEMAKAQNFDEFMTALRHLWVPMFTVLYADREGNILSLFNAQVPRRVEGDWDFWFGFTVLGGQANILPGDTARYLWTEYHDFEELPLVVNPPGGWVQNANEPPWTMALDPQVLDAVDYPAYMAPPPYSWPRPSQSFRLLMEDESITFDELRDYKFSTFVELTIPVLDELIAAAQASEDVRAQQAAEVLANWDRRMDAESRGAILFARWAQVYVEPIGFDLFREQWHIDDPLNTPFGLADAEAAAAALAQVAGELELTRLLGGGMDAPFGQFFRMRAGEVDLPASGTPDVLGSMSTLNYAAADGLRFVPVQGDSYIALVEFGETVRAEVLLTYGNSTQPGSPHVGDQLALFAARELRLALFTRADVEANAVAREVVGEE